MGVGFGLFISRLSKTENDDFGVRKDLRDILDDLIMKLIKKLSSLAAGRVKTCGRILIRNDDYDMIIQEYFGEGPFERVIKKEANRSIENKGSDLVLPVSRIKRCVNEKVAMSGLIYLGGVLEQVLIEIFDQVIVVSKKRNKKSMTLKDLWKGIKDDEELSRLFSHE